MGIADAGYVMVGKATPLRILGSWQPGKPGKPGCLLASLVAWNFSPDVLNTFEWRDVGLGEEKVLTDSRSTGAV